MTLHDTSFPGESPEYRRARDELLEAELQLRRQIESVAAQRRALPHGGEVPDDYVFTEWDAAAGKPRPVRFSELFARGKDSLVLYSFMFKPGETGLPLEVPCPLCTSIIDGIDGAVPHITQRTNFAVVTKAPIESFSAHARARGWRHARLLSSAGTSFNADYRVESGDDDQYAMVTAFVRDGGTIRHFWSSETWFMPAEPGQNPRHVDFMWPLWAVLDRTPEGRGSDWWPSLAYSSPDAVTENSLTRSGTATEHQLAPVEDRALCATSGSPLMAETMTTSLVHQYAAMKPTEFGKNIEPKWQVAGTLVKQVQDAVEQKSLTPLDGARLISSITATLFGYDEFILREFSPESLLAGPARR